MQSYAKSAYDEPGSAPKRACSKPRNKGRVVAKPSQTVRTRMTSATPARDAECLVFFGNDIGFRSGCITNRVTKSSPRSINFTRSDCLPGPKNSKSVFLDTVFSLEGRRLRCGLKSKRTQPTGNGAKRYAQVNYVLVPRWVLILSWKIPTLTTIT